MSHSRFLRTREESGDDNNDDMNDNNNIVNNDDDMDKQEGEVGLFFVLFYLLTYTHIYYKQLCSDRI